MHLEPTATVNLGLLMFFAAEDIRYISKVQLKISNPKGKSITLLSEGVQKLASVEAEIVLSHLCFRAKVLLDETHWDEFIMTFFQDESPLVTRGNSVYSYTNTSAYNFCEGYGAVWEENPDTLNDVVDDNWLNNNATTRELLTEPKALPFYL